MTSPIFYVILKKLLIKAYIKIFVRLVHVILFYDKIESL